MTTVLILFYSRYGNTAKMAHLIAHGVESITQTEARIRTVPGISAKTEAAESNIPENGPPYVTKQDLKECHGLIMGSPTRFGNMAAPLKYFLDDTGSEWFSGTLVDKPAAVFTSTGTMHGGQESTLLSMMIPLMHHGMLISGIPYTEPALNYTKTGGSPYGATHYAGANADQDISADEKTLCIALGKRIATLTKQLNN